jgi:flavin reductase (DIM6/NTAB) family NADH-FMN oxidoreductase RutF
VGDHTIFVGEVLSARVNKGLFDECWLIDKQEARTIHHLGGKVYATIWERVGRWN